MKLTTLSLVAAVMMLLSCGSTRTTTTTTTGTGTAGTDAGTTTTTSTTATTTTAHAAYDVPTSLQTAFGTQYPGAASVTWSAFNATNLPIDWEMTGWPTLTSKDYVVTFNMGKDRYYAWYTANGEWIGTVHAVTDHSTLPEGVRNLINTQFAGYTIDEVDREMWKDKLAYEIKLKRGNDDKVKLLVDASGTIIKQKLKD